MDVWKVLQSVGSILGGTSFLLLVLNVLFKGKVSDWFAAKSEARNHRLAIIREQDRVNSELRSKIMLELFQRKISAHEKLRAKAFETSFAFNLAKVFTKEEPNNHEKVEAAKHNAMRLLENFTYIATGAASDISGEAFKLCDHFETLCVLTLHPELVKGGEDEIDIPGKIQELFAQFNAELREIYFEGFESLIKPRESGYASKWIRTKMEPKDGSDSETDVAEGQL